jgi:hypothetical protein
MHFRRFPGIITVKLPKRTGFPDTVQLEFRSGEYELQEKMTVSIAFFLSQQKSKDKKLK